jgi:hypothetical protein
MIRTALIYLAVLTYASFFSGRMANAVDQNPVVFESMKPVSADGKNIAPKIMDFTKDPDADKAAKPKLKKLATN